MAATLIPNAAEVELVCVRPKAGAIELEVRARRPSSSCLSCGRISTQVHSGYRRTLTDLPWQGLPVRILLHSRKFFCRNELSFVTFGGTLLIWLFGTTSRLKGLENSRLSGILLCLLRLAEVGRSWAQSKCAT